MRGSGAPAEANAPSPLPLPRRGEGDRRGVGPGQAFQGQGDHSPESVGAPARFAGSVPRSGLRPGNATAAGRASVGPGDMRRALDLAPASDIGSGDFARRGSPSPGRGAAGQKSPEPGPSAAEETTVQSDVRRRLGQALGKIDRPGSFCVAGSAPAVLPGLEVEGLGPIGLPLTAAQARELIKRCDQAPYGKGEQTLVDTRVRRVRRMEPDRFSLTNPDWDRFVAQTVAQVEAALGAGEAEAHEPSLRPAPLRARQLLPAAPRRREAGPHGRDPGHRPPLATRRGRAGGPARGAGTDDRPRRLRGRPVSSPVRGLLCRLRARGPADQEGLSPLPRLQPDARPVEVQEAPQRPPRLGTRQGGRCPGPRMGGRPLGREASHHARPRKYTQDGVAWDSLKGTDRVKAPGPSSTPPTGRRLPRPTSTS